MTIAAHNPKYRYVEGMAMDPRDPERWIMHAWLTDADGGRAYDPTWQAIHPRTSQTLPFPTQYIGIEMDMKAVAAFVIKTEYKSVLVNGWRYRSLARAAMKSIVR